ncbi:MAG: hypothetical protein IIZ93_09190 [Acidaminococcaceae bacterium]|nr:hypothetical protein [Acidaminococcaceae bacterium]
MKYIQSFYQYPVTLSSIGKTIPARSAQGPLKNLMEIEDKELERVENCEPYFRELVNKKKVRVLNHMPEAYVSSAQRINEANDEIARLKAENEALKAKAGKTTKEPVEEEPAEEAEETTDEGVVYSSVPAEEPKKTSSKKSKK